MYWIFHFIVAHRRVFSLLLTSLVSLLLITAPPVKQAAVLRFLSMTVFFPLQAVTSRTMKIRNIFAENRRLKREVIRLSTTVAQLKDESYENKRLRDMLNFTPKFTYDFLPVRVIAYDPSPAQKSIVVSAGEKERVTMWMPVVDESGVVGKVVQVMHHISLVQLLKDPSNRTGVLFRRTGAIGILETENGRDFFVRCRDHEPIEIGDTAVTSGLGGIYPRGLTVGIVRRIDTIRDPLFKRVMLALTVNFDHLEELFVLRMSSQWGAFRTELDSIEFSDD
ncbi:MAG: rod shape-determining protein MreC [Chitinispirillaceae bacterium]|nr:rod shape-determining protein MreC [Chitinispirillaceae bacterium]